MADRAILNMINFHLRISILTMIYLLLPLLSCAGIHRYGAYYGKVVDAETKEPLGGAAVLAVYYTESYGPAGAHIHYLDAQETQTDKKGEFNIPPSIAKSSKIGHSFKPHPYFTIFKPGYGCYPKHKAVKPMFVPNGTLPVNQQVTIKLPKLENREERIKNQRCLPLLVPKINYRQLLLSINEERISLGLPAVPLE